MRDSTPRGGDRAWSAPRGERPQGGKREWEQRPRDGSREPRAREDRPWRPAEGQGDRNNRGGAPGPGRDRVRDDDRRPGGRDAGSTTRDGSARRFERKGFERNQGTEEPRTPPRPRGPNREPRPNETPEPTPPPRPSEPVVPPPGPPERGRLVKTKRRP
jgi:hypothetical protein